MSTMERKRNRKRPEAEVANNDVAKPEKVEYEIAKFLRSNLPLKQTTLLGHKVDYFIASKAIDLLMTSKWAQTDKRTDKVMFASRESVVDFMNQMLVHKFFHRAKTIIVKKEIKIKPENVDSNDECSKSESKKQTKSKEKKKVKFDMHLHQVFVDGNEPYVWIYDYISLKTWLIGSGLVLAAIAICLFPLWPRTVRNYVYYISIAVAALLFFIIFLAVFKLIVFAIIWTLTFGKHHVWILPNLTEDVGFFESFWPLYQHSNKSNEKQTEQSESCPEKRKEDGGVAEDDEEERNEDEDKESEAESVSTTDSNVKGTNGFEMLDTNECNEDA